MNEFRYEDELYSQATYDKSWSNDRMKEVWGEWKPEDFEKWRQRDFLSIHEAAVLIAGGNAEADRLMLEQIGGSDVEKGYSKVTKQKYGGKYALFLSMLIENIQGENTIKAVPANTKLKDGQIQLNVFKTEVGVGSLVKWLEDYFIKPPFFFPDKGTYKIPEYLNPNNEFYSLRLHAAVCAWEVTAGILMKTEMEKQMVPTEMMKLWISNEFPDLSDTAVEEIAKMANWVKQSQRPRKSSNPKTERDIKLIQKINQAIKEHPLYESNYVTLLKGLNSFK